MWGILAVAVDTDAARASKGTRQNSVVVDSARRNVAGYLYGSINGGKGNLVLRPPSTGTRRKLGDFACCEETCRWNSQSILHSAL